jgi:hypothetical protein
MTKASEKKEFDCVEMQHEGQRAVYARIGHLSREEQLAYWERRTEELRKRLAALHPEHEEVEQEA